MTPLRIVLAVLLVGLALYSLRVMRRDDLNRAAVEHVFDRMSDGRPPDTGAARRRSVDGATSGAAVRSR